MLGFAARTSQPSPLRAFAFPSLSHSDTCAGCIVSCTTPTSASVRRSSSTSSRAAAGERGQGASCVVLSPVKAAVDDALHAPSERLEQRRYHQSGGDMRDRRFLAGSGPKGRME